MQILVSVLTQKHAARLISYALSVSSVNIFLPKGLIPFHSSFCSKTIKRYCAIRNGCTELPTYKCIPHLDSHQNVHRTKSKDILSNLEYTVKNSYIFKVNSNIVHVYFLNRYPRIMNHLLIFFHDYVKWSLKNSLTTFKELH